jgi:hypothetical protein
MAALPLKITLDTPSRTVKAGEAVQISIQVTNTSDSPIWMLGVLDGSEPGYRYPHYTPNIDGPESASLGDGPFWDGTTIPLRVEDFIQLAPGQSFDPTNPQNGAGYQPLYLFSRFVPRTPGQYKIGLTLSTENESDEAWGVISVDYPGKREIAQRLAEVPRGSVEAEPLTIEVT